MSMNYIEVYRQNDILNAKIHKIVKQDGKIQKKVCTITNPNNIKKLLNICHKHNMYFNGDKVLKGNVDPIIREFDSYYANIKRRNKKLMILATNLDNIIDKAIVIRKDPTFNKIVVTSTLIAALGFSSMAIIKSYEKIGVSEDIYVPQTTIEEIPEYVEDVENIVINDENTIPTISVENISAEDISISDVSQFDQENIVIEENNEILVDEQNIIEDIETTDENEVGENNEVNQMLQSNQFHFSYTDRTTNGCLDSARRYEDIFECYANRYGVDKNLLMAIASQENRGLHYEALNSNYATGIMQIERSANMGSTVSAYNFETNQMDSITVTQDRLENVDTNIQIAAMIIRNKLEENNYNIPLSLQSYNFGSGNMSRALSMCSDIENIPINSLKNGNNAWLNYRSFLGVGDPEYVEHVFSFIPNETVLTVKDRDGNNISMQVINDNVNNLQLN